MIEVGTFQETLLCRLDNPQLELNDIALDPNGALYGMEVTKLYKIDPLTGVTTLLHDFAPENFVGLVSDANGKLYLAGEKIFAFDPATGIIQDLGVPPQPCAGDLTFWNGDLYMTASDGMIFKINQQNAAQSTVYMNPGFPYVGFVTIWNCVTGKSRTFAFSGANTIEIDMANKTYWSATNNFIPASGATSPWEWLSSANTAPSIDTIIRHNPDCGMANGSIEFVPAAAEQGMLEFSLDSLNWQSSGLFTQLPGGVHTVYLRGGACLHFQTLVVLDNAHTMPISAAPISAAICTSAVGKAVVHPAGNPVGLAFSADGGVAQSDTLFNALSKGFHVFTATDANGCKSFAYTFIQDSSTAFIFPVTTTPDSAQICPGVPLTLTTDGPPNAVYTWYVNDQLAPGENGPELVLTNNNPVGAYYYRVSLVDQYGCTASASASGFRILDCTRLPNAFTPNGDGANDVFRQVGAAPGETYTLVIYDRWGQKIYEETSARPQWDGRLNGEPAPSEVYVYSFISAAGIVQSGEVTLLR